jgi:AcrR family transcriptional regulator
MTSSTTSPADSEQRRRSAQLEAAILEAARDLLAKGGIAGLSMRMVAERVGVSATAIYHYFKGKQDLVDRVVRMGFERFGDYLERGMAAHPKGSLRRIRALAEAYLRFALENQAYFRVIFSIQPQHERSMQDLPEGGGYHLLRQGVVDAMEAGTIRRADPDLMSLYLWSSVHGLVTLVLSCTEPLCEGQCIPMSPVELYDAFGPFIVDGIRARSLEDARTDSGGRV